MEAFEEGVGYFAEEQTACYTREAPECLRGMCLVVAWLPYVALLHPVNIQFSSVSEHKTSGEKDHGSTIICFATRVTQMFWGTRTIGEAGESLWRWLGCVNSRCGNSIFGVRSHV